MKENMRVMNILGKLLLSISFICFTGLASFASDNNLSSVEISNLDGNYYINFTADKPTEVRKTVQSANEIVLNLKNTSPVESVATIYNNVPDVDSVLIMPELNETRVIIRGKEISEASVSFVSKAAQIAKSQENKAEIALNMPVSSYTPVYSKSEETLYEQNSGLNIKELASSYLVLSPAMKSYLKKAYNCAQDIGGGYLALGMIFLLIIVFGVKALASSSKNDELKIGLAQSLKEKEVTLQNQFSLSDELRTLRAQKTVASRPVPSMNYGGLKAYQASQKNPYTSQHTSMPVQRPAAPARRQPLASEAPLVEKFNQARAAEKVTSSIPVEPALRQTYARVQQGQTVDSMKFLQSMAKIYERNGRTDLANGLKSNIQRVHSMK